MVGEVRSYFGKKGIVSSVNNCFPDKDDICEYFPISSESTRSIHRLTSMRKIEIRLATLPGRTAARENIPLR